MKLYTDVFKKPIKKEEVAAVVRQIVSENRPTSSFITRRFGFGYAKASVIIRLLEDADVISLMHRGKRTVLIKDVDGAVNASLRQLRKGNA